MAGGTTQAISDGVVAGVATGMGAGLIAWLIPLFRSKHLVGRIKKLEAQVERDKAFKEIVIKSQMKQIDLFQLVIDRQIVSCEECPANIHLDKDTRTQKTIDDARKELQDYLGKLA